MNDKGFSLIELLAVIAILALVMGISMPVISIVRESISEKTLEKKYSMLETAAILYGEDHQNTLDNSVKKYNGNNCIMIQVKDLVPNYTKSETGKECKNDNTCIKNEVTNNYLDNDSIIIYSKNNRVHAVYVHDSEECK